MHAVFGLKQAGLAFELKAGTSLSKGFVRIPGHVNTDSGAM